MPSSPESPEILMPRPEMKPIKRSIELIIGPEGSGKSTIGNRLAQYFDKPKKSIGDVIREASLIR
jgi:nicotinamide riboside kinase